MKVSRIFLIAAAMLAALPFQAGAEKIKAEEKKATKIEKDAGQEVGIVYPEALKIRIAPGSEEFTELVYKDDEVIVLAHEGDWLKVQTEAGTVGYCHSMYCNYKTVYGLPKVKDPVVTTSHKSAKKASAKKSDLAEVVTESKKPKAKAQEADVQEVAANSDADEEWVDPTDECQAWKAPRDEEISWQELLNREEEPVWEEPAWEEPTWEESAWEEPTWEEPVWEEPTWDACAWEEPVWEEPTWDACAWEEPVWEEPASSWVPEPDYTWTPETEYTWTPEPDYTWTPETDYTWTPETEYTWTPEPDYTWTPETDYTWTSEPDYTWTPEPEYTWTPEPDNTWQPEQTDWTTENQNTFTYGQDIVNTASQYLGNPYVWGGVDPMNGIDCSGLTQYAYASVGVSIPRVAQDQWSLGYEVPLNQVEQGNLVFYDNEWDGIVDHVGIYIGNGQILHAANPDDGIIVSDMYYMQPAGAAYY